MTGIVAGSAKVEITPSDLAGLNAMGPGFDGIHDRLFARAVVIGCIGSWTERLSGLAAPERAPFQSREATPADRITSGDKSRAERGVWEPATAGVHDPSTDIKTAPVAIVSLDLLEYGDAGPLLARIADEVGIPADHIMITASHAHNAPRAGTSPAGALSRPPTPESLAFTQHLDDCVVTAVRQAAGAMRPARLGVGKGRVDVNVNRDELVDGVWRLGVNPSGPSDKTLTVMAIEADDGPVAVLMNYAVHATVALGVPLLSADLAGAAASAVEQTLGGVACWLPGSLADQAPKWSFEIARHAGSQPTLEQVFQQLDGLAGQLATETARVVATIDNWVTDGAVCGAAAIVECPAKQGTDQAGDMRQDVVDQVGLNVSVLHLGPWRLVGIGGELTTAGADLLWTTPDTIVVSLANQRVGYLADPDAFTAGTFAARGCPVGQSWLALVADELAGLIGQP